MTPRFITHAVPLVATLGKAEIEHAAALVLFALHHLGRDWTASVAAKELGTVITAELEAEREPIRSWARNPFLRPDFAGLVRLGFATRGESPLGSTLTLTAEAVARVAVHLVPVGGAPVVHVEDAPEAVTRAREVAP